jgi:hypothetical protein
MTDSDAVSHPTDHERQINRKKLYGQTELYEATLKYRGAGGYAYLHKRVLLCSRHGSGVPLG